MTAFFLAIASVLLAGLALLPGSLGILKFTHKVAATPRGAYLLFKLSLPVYVLSLGLLASSGFLAWQHDSTRGVVLAAAVLIGGISFFAFLMHAGLMFKPVRDPIHISLDEAIKRFGEKEEIVGVLDAHGKPFAYVARLQRRPHIVYETDSETPFISTHCILAHSSMAYEMSGHFARPNICISSAVANNMVFYEKNKNLAFQQIYNQTTDGDNQLTPLPTVMTSLQSWKRVYPDSKVWIRPKEWRDTFYLKLLARASVIDPASPDLVYPLQNQVDQRLPLKAYVNGVTLAGEARAYALSMFKDAKTIEDTIGNEPVVFFASDDGDFVQLYSRKLQAGQTATFRALEAEKFQDLETRSTWRIDGLCVSGKLNGTRLRPIPHYNKIFWFCWSDFFPKTTIYEHERQESVESGV
ncbi:MAG: DUF3179 domain-containing (seleno)protein [bacterium]